MGRYTRGNGAPGRRLWAALTTTALTAGVLAGVSLVSAGSAAAAEVTVPTAPTVVTARAGVNKAKVYWSAPTSDGGSAVTSYTATASPGGATCTGGSAARSCYVPSLTNGQAYTFTVTASNQIGPSAPSTATDPVTPRTDTQDPKLLGTTFSTTRVSSLGGTFTVDLRITDDVSGIRTPSGGLDANPAVLLQKRGATSNTVGFTRAVNRVSGDEYDGIYRATINVPSGTASGWWDLQVYPIDDNAGNSTFFQTVPGILVGAAAAPTNVVVTPAANRNLTVTWDAPTDNGGNFITGYQLTDSYTNTTRTVTGTTWTGPFADIASTQPVTFTVAAVNSAGVGATSAASSPVTVPAVVTSAPRNVTATRGNQEASVSWTAPATTGGAPVTSYTVTTTPGGATKTVTSGTSTTIGDLVNGTSYTFAVIATNTAGASPAGTSAAAVPAGVPTTATDVSAVAGDTTATVSWSAADANGTPVTSYTVTSAPGGLTATVPGDATTATVNGLTNGTAYTFTITAANSVGTGTASDLTETVTPKGAPLKVTGVSVVRGDKSAQVYWSPATANGSHITGYTVMYNGQSVQLDETATSTLLTGLANGTVYSVTVTATNAVGTSPASTTVTFTPAGLPSKVAGVTAKAGDRAATVSWTPATGNGAAVSSYKVTTSPGGKVTTVAGSAKSAKVTGLNNGKAYTFTVVAVNSVGSAAASTASRPVIAAGVPGKVTKPKSKVSGRTITLTWAAPSANGAPVKAYRVSGGKPAVKVVNARKIAFKGLKPGTYKFTVQARNSVGWSAKSTVVVVRVKK